MHPQLTVCMDNVEFQLEFADEADATSGAEHGLVFCEEEIADDDIEGAHSSSVESHDGNSDPSVHTGDGSLAISPVSDHVVPERRARGLGRRTCPFRQQHVGSAGLSCGSR